MDLRRIRNASILAMALLPWTPCLEAGQRCEQAVGRLASVEGTVDVIDESGGQHEGRLDATLCEGDTIEVGSRARAAVLLTNNTVLRIDQDTTVRLSNIAAGHEEFSWIDLTRGAIYTFGRQPLKLKVITRSLMALIKGTEFYVRAEDGRSSLAVFEGSVQVTNSQGTVMAIPGSEVVAEQGRNPRSRAVVRPRDAVQWSYYYPPILAIFDSRDSRLPEDVPEVVRMAYRTAARGDTAGAFGLLEQVPDSDRREQYLLFRAALFLSAGRAREGEADLDEALRQDPKSPLAHALRAMILVVQNRREQALQEAEQADRLGSSAATKIALSYARQAGFQLEGARDELLAAARRHPDDHLVWARLGELELMLGNRRAALDAALKAIALSPGSARANTVLGFSALAEFDRDEARSAFERAIAVDSDEPLAHLGLGLARISGGELVEGRRELEIAVALDSDNALLRAYLGKAYFTEKRAPLDGAQYRQSKAMDPLDPTAYFYDGIRKQAENRPVEALDDLKASIDRNDSRAVYRSRLLLDQDRAARASSLARVYRDLGFTELGLREAGRSLDLDPSNASAHRFLSDSYQGVRRREISRVSELLQAQLTQDVNLNPIQPSLAEVNLNALTIGGPATPGFNEFTPLFDGNGVKFDAAGFGGSNDTYGGEGALTARYDRHSFGAGAFHYQSDGWRPNNGLNQQVYDVFAQTAITPALNVQAEFRRRESEEGDLAFNFDPDLFLLDKTVNRRQDTTRFGVRYTPAAGSNFLFSYIHNHRTQQERAGSVPVDPTTTASSDLREKVDGDQFEGQYLYQRERFNLVAGLGYSQVDQRARGEVTFFDSTLPAPIVNTDASGDRIKHARGYLYSHIKLPLPVTWTLGFSYADYREGLLAQSRFDPKFGAQWDVTDDFRVRAAVFRTHKPALVNNRTIEPTTVAGFNQFFDDADAAHFWRYGGGFDWRPMHGLFLGGEITWREVEDPVYVFGSDGSESSYFEDRQEQLHSLYVYWTPTERLGVRQEFVYDRFRSEKGVATEGGAPDLAETFAVPTTLSYFHSSGFFARLGGTFVHQRVVRTTDQDSGNDSFFLVDADIGYRLPQRLGTVSLGVKNLLGTQFRYQDDSYREFRDEPATGPYFPDRIAMGRIMLHF